jgi:hypothetical protein
VSDDWLADIAIGALMLMVVTILAALLWVAALRTHVQPVDLDRTPFTTETT